MGPGDATIPEPVAAIAVETDPAAASNEDLNCPLCGYDVRGLPEPRCPECGHQFDPEALRRAKFERRDWLFEHAQRRLALAFIGTTLRSLVPWMFWNDISPAHAVVARRLRLWAIVWISVIVASNVSAMAWTTIRLYLLAHAPPLATGMTILPSGRYVYPIGPTAGSSGPTAPAYIGWGRSQFGWMDAINFSFEEIRGPSAIAAVSAVLAWPAITLLALSLFGITLRRAGIQRGHLWRCALYAWPGALLTTGFGVAVLIVCGFARSTMMFDQPSEIAFREMFLSAATATLLLVSFTLTTFHLVVSHVRYLRLPHGVMQALLVSVVSWLAILAAFALLHQMS